MRKVYNFSPGPAMLPATVLERAREELRGWRSSGVSPMEMSHRGADFIGIAEKAEAGLRAALAVPTDYKILFLAGGATAQFGAAPMNLLRGKTKLAYVETGYWSRKAIEEAKLFADVDVAASSRDGGYATIPPRTSWRVDPAAAYLHYTANETIGGVEFHDTPQSDGLPLVADMSSNLLSRPIDVTRFGLIYASAQKNLGLAGLAVVIVRENLIGRPLPGTPSIFDYRRQADEGSMVNTPPTYAWYMAGLMLEWVAEQGGVEAIERRNIRKASRLYAAIDASSFYSNFIDPAVRSRMNAPFRLADASLDKTFLAAAAEAGLVSLEGHRSVGGMRASIYNAMPDEGVETLITFMRDFEKRWG
ncbi:3-phosphoserine/phosphohydroxythreonine transaminase [Methylosinus sp. PW1]|uniref:3-phosphoserine/phosphohydroxythreonine transaminase n=1 Tax=Methylosinus sp. PW1 TaxID=107636 RepID=UPI00055DB236|nr:3-phosphoserine/phosphohydroxythreonine transaminase [Methylosinus sp. PW1]